MTVNGPSRVPAIVRLVHLAPSVAVTALSGALGAILLAQSGRPLDERWLAMLAAVAGSQIFIGATNDLVDRSRDEAAGRLMKPLAAGDLDPGTAVWVASLGMGIQLAASLRLGGFFTLLGLLAAGSALAYNLWLSRTPLSVLPYLVSFGILPIWVATGVGAPLDRVAIAPFLVAPFAAAAHLANVLRDFDADAAQGSRNIAQVLGRRRAFGLAWALAIGTGMGVGAALLIGGAVNPLALALGLSGLLAVAQGVRGPDALWIGMLVAAVCWTAGWALGTA
jgi:4-hydroxybenzoate polyprenyltransferase